jgi:hypothetical protein
MQSDESSRWRLDRFTDRGGCGADTVNMGRAWQRISGMEPRPAQLRVKPAPRMKSGARRRPFGVMAMVSSASSAAQLVLDLQ